MKAHFEAIRPVDDRAVDGSSAAATSIQVDCMHDALLDEQIGQLSQCETPFTAGQRTPLAPIVLEKHKTTSAVDASCGSLRNFGSFERYHHLAITNKPAKASHEFLHALRFAELLCQVADDPTIG